MTVYGKILYPEAIVERAVIVHEAVESRGRDDDVRDTQLGQLLTVGVPGHWQLVHVLSWNINTQCNDEEEHSSTRTCFEGFFHNIKISTLCMQTLRPNSFLLLTRFFIFFLFRQSIFSRYPLLMCSDDN